jgi:hypothetical protein
VAHPCNSSSEVSSWGQLLLRFLTVASIAGVMVVEPFMFIGFALLYIKMTEVSSASNVGLASQLA